MNTIDTLYYFTSKETLENIISDGFKPSYANERFGDWNILIPMVSFSNVLLRDIGHDQVLSYGEFGIGFSRLWGIQNNINPVVYSFNEGVTAKAIKAYLDNSVLISRISSYKENLKKFSDHKCGPFSKRISVSNTSKESMDIIDYLSMQFNEELVDIISRYGQVNFEQTKTLILLAKPYEVENNDGEKFIAYNDREWRKTYPQLDFILDSEESYQEMKNRKKPHLIEEEYRLNFDLTDISVIVVEKESDIEEIKNKMYNRFGNKTVEARLKSEDLKIDTKDNLIKKGY
jgi:hypothetical protein